MKTTPMLVLSSFVLVTGCSDQRTIQELNNQLHQEKEENRLLVDKLGHAENKISEMELTIAMLDAKRISQQEDIDVKERLLLEKENELQNSKIELLALKKVLSETTEKTEIQNVTEEEISRLTTVFRRDVLNNEHYSTFPYRPPTNQTIASGMWSSQPSLVWDIPYVIRVNEVAVTAISKEQSNLQVELTLSLESTGIELNEQREYYGNLRALLKVFNKEGVFIGEASKEVAEIEKGNSKEKWCFVFPSNVTSPIEIEQVQLRFIYGSGSKFSQRVKGDKPLIKEKKNDSPSSQKGYGGYRTKKKSTYKPLK